MTFKKTLLIALIFVLVITLPLVMISNSMMDVYQDKIDAHPTSGFNKWLQLTTAGICFKTDRPERALDGYKKYMERFPEDPEYAFCLLRYAQSLEEAKRYEEALEQYDLFLTYYPSHDDVETARQGITRIKYGPGH